jgi:hypothetical protein
MVTFERMSRLECNLSPFAASGSDCLNKSSEAPAWELDFLNIWKFNWKRKCTPWPSTCPKRVATFVFPFLIELNNLSTKLGDEERSPN